MAQGGDRCKQRTEKISPQRHRVRRGFQFVFSAFSASPCEISERLTVNFEPPLGELAFFQVPHRARLFRSARVVGHHENRFAQLTIEPVHQFKHLLR